MNAKDTHTSQPNPLDYDQLKAYGLEYIRSIANKQWTDFNLHDPGVTILEALCFSLTDLAYRTRFSMADLLTEENNNHPQLSGTLFPAHQILSHEPITADDYRKYLLETVPGIRNVWVDTAPQTVFIPEIGTIKEHVINIKGRYRFSIELEDSAYILGNSRLQTIISHDEKWRFLGSFGKNFKDAYKNYIRNFYLKHRNLCEDYEEVKFLDPVRIGIHAEIETEKNANHQQLIEEITKRVEEYFSPTLKFHSLAELVNMGKKPEEIYQGPLPRIGFIDPEELKQHKKKESIYISDILNILMKINGVVSVKRLYFLVDENDLEPKNNTKPNIETTGSYDNCHEVRLINKDCVFCLSTFNDKSSAKNEIYFIRNGFTFAPHNIEYGKLSKETIALPDNNIQVEFPIPEGRNRNTTTYYSFQHLFPKSYRMGIERIPESASNLHKAARLQLKAYLTLFDQLIADYLEQLGAIEQYFSVAPNEGEDPIDPTYFFHELNEEEIVDVNQVFNPLTKKDPLTIEQRLSGFDRRSRILDHLLARFNDAFVDYSLLAYLNNPDSAGISNGLFNTKAIVEGNKHPIHNYSSISNAQATPVKRNKKALLTGLAQMAEEIEDKKRLLRNYPILSSARSQAIDYTEEVMLNGVERMILAKLGVNNPKYDCVPPIVRTITKKSPDKKTITVKHYFYDNRKDDYNNNFGIHIIEHPLLLPDGKITENRFLKLSREDRPGTLLEDPYSFHATVLVTGWLDICQNTEFRTFVENTIRQTFPAHVAVKTCWVDPFIMWKTENIYRDYLSILKRRPIINVTKKDWMKWTAEKNKGIETMLKAFDNFRNIYPSIILPNSDGSGYELRPRLDFMHIDTWTDDIGAGEEWREERKDESGNTVNIIEKWTFSKQKENN